MASDGIVEQVLGITLSLEGHGGHRAVAPWSGTLPDTAGLVLLTVWAHKTIWAETHEAKTRDIWHAGLVCRAGVVSTLVVYNVAAYTRKANVAVTLCFVVVVVGHKAECVSYDVHLFVFEDNMFLTKPMLTGVLRALVLHHPHHTQPQNRF